MAITKDIVADYGCPTDGTSDVRPAFLAFKADAQGQTATLNIPAGTYTFGNYSSFPEDVFIFKGIPDLTVNGTGATLAIGTQGYWLGGKGMSGFANTFAKVDSVYPGARYVKCKTVAEASNFIVGNYVALTGLATQGNWASSFGFPPNLHFFEFLKVASVNGTTGVVTFVDPVTKTYRDHWPEYGQGDLPFQGGPATIYALDASWDCVHRYNISGLPSPTFAINCAGRDITFRNYVQSGASINPSQNETMRFIDCTLGAVEVDKMVGTLSYEGTTTAGQVQFQSSSIDLFQMLGTSSVTFLDGTPKKVKTEPGTTIGTLSPGCIYGRTDELYFDGSTISTIIHGSNQNKGPSDAGINVGYSMSNGVISFPNTGGAVSWAVPGSYIYWSGPYSTETVFRILDITQDATNVYIQTDMTGSFPSVPLTSGKLYIRSHGAPKATFVNCVGCPEVVDWSQFGTIPLASRSRRTYTKANIGTSGGNIHVPGKVQSIKFDVTAAFAGTQNPLTFKGGGEFDNTKTLGPPTSYTTADYGPIINLRASPRTIIITPSGVTGNVAGDSNLTLPDPFTWLTGTLGQAVSNNVSADPSNFSITVEIITDQGIVEDRRSARMRARFR